MFRGGLSCHEQFLFDESGRHHALHCIHLFAFKNNCCTFSGKVDRARRSVWRGTFEQVHVSRPRIFSALLSDHNKTMGRVEIALDVCWRHDKYCDVFAARDVADPEWLAYARVYAQCN